MVIFGAWPGLELVHFSCDHADSQMLARNWAGKGKELPLSLMRLRKKEVSLDETVFICASIKRTQIDLSLKDTYIISKFFSPCI